MKWQTPMNGKKIAVTPSAYAYPLLIKQLLRAPLAQTAHRELLIAMFGGSPTSNCAIASANWRALLTRSACAPAIRLRQMTPRRAAEFSTSRGAFQDASITMADRPEACEPEPDSLFRPGGSDVTDPSAR
jgi:hypothetical protein